jgi:hypothetical protein
VKKDISKDYLGIIVNTGVTPLTTMKELSVFFSNICDQGGTVEDLPDTLRIITYNYGNNFIMFNTEDIKT